jgi:hypothetical protein
MIAVELFLGFPCTSEYLSIFQELPASLVKVFVSQDASYLQKLETEGGSFLGKRIGKEVDVEGLKNLEANIYSLLNRLTPDFPIKDTSLVLFPVPCQ